MTVHAVIVMVTTSLTIAVFLGLAIYVAVNNPPRPIRWVFTLLCLTIAMIYFSSLFMVSRPGSPVSILSMFLRLKWVAITLSPTLFLHLVFFYFPQPWQQYRRWTLFTTYALTAGLVFAILFTDLLVVGLLHRPAPHIILPMPGPLVPLQAGFFMLQLFGGALGLTVSYRLTPSSAMRHQIFLLLIATGLVLVGSVIHWLYVFMSEVSLIPHELPDALLIMAAFIFAKTVVHYGLFAGRPLTRRSLFYSMLTAMAGLTALYLTFSLDRWLMTYTEFPYPPLTGMLVLALTFGFPAASRWLTQRLDERLFQAERQQRELAQHLARALAETPAPEQLQTELLTTLCTILRVRYGYIAVSKSETSPDLLTVQAVQGELPIKPGDQVRRPQDGFFGEPQLASPLQTQTPADFSWPNIALFCPLTIGQQTAGVLALGEKYDGTPFSPYEINLCTDLSRQLDTIGRMVRLREQRNQYLEAARNQHQALRQLSEEVVTSANQTLTIWKRKTIPLEIRILGPLQVIKNGQPLAETAWGSEKAKALLAYLLWKSPLGATREELSEVLWPERPFEETANVFHVTLHKLRRVLQPESGRNGDLSYIQYDRGRYRFNTDAPHWLDAVAFHDLVTCHEPAAQKAAVDLYRGSYLEDIAWALPGEVEVERRQVEQLYADALRRLTVQANEREAIIYLEKLLLIEPADETAYRALVLSYLARGRGDLARRQVAKWQQALAEFDLEPTPEALIIWQMVEAKNGQPHP